MLASNGQQRDRGRYQLQTYAVRHRAQPSAMSLHVHVRGLRMLLFPKILRQIAGQLGRIRSKRLAILLHDSLLITLAFPLSILLRENFSPASHHLAPIAYGSGILFIISFFVLRLAGVQQNMWRYLRPTDLLALGRALCIVTALFFPLMFLIDRLEGIPRTVLVIFWCTAFAALSVSRTLYIHRIRLKNVWSKEMRRSACRVLVLADPGSSSAIIQTVEVYLKQKARIVGIISSDGEHGRIVLGAEILGSARELPQILATLDVSGNYPDVIVLGAVDDEIRAELDAGLKVAPEIAVFDSSAISELAVFIERLPNDIQLRHANQVQPSYFRAKRFIDVASASVALVVLSPLMAVIFVLISLFDGLPVFFTQVRAGQHRREFQLIKFRTMRAPYGREGRMLDDHERATLIGRFLRSCRFDELPQFWNVLCGDMSLIGPRPLLRPDMPTDEKILNERYSVKPGITGWAQVNGGRIISNADRHRLDIYYIRNASFVLDVIISIRTVKTMMLGESVDYKVLERANDLELTEQ